jgi:hypothetical protein
MSIAQRRVEHAPIVVDLTLPTPPQELTSTGKGLPGFSNLSRVTLLPVALKIESIQRKTVSGKQGANLSLIIQNLSEKDFEFPVGRGLQATMEDSRRGRKEFAFLLRALCNTCDRKQLKTVALTASSSSLPDTYVVLKPGDQAYVKLFVDTGSYLLGPAEIVLDLQLGCQQTEFEDGRYVIKNTSTIAWLDLSLPTPHRSQSSEVK